MDGRADRIAAPSQVEDRQLSARAGSPVLGWVQVRGRVAQQADGDGVQDQDDGGYAGERGDRDYVGARR
jgi:hypothetical protein